MSKAYNIKMNYQHLNLQKEVKVQESNKNLNTIWPEPKEEPNEELALRLRASAETNDIISMIIRKGNASDEELKKLTSLSSEVGEIRNVVLNNGKVLIWGEDGYIIVDKKELKNRAAQGEQPTGVALKGEKRFGLL